MLDKVTLDCCTSDAASAVSSVRKNRHPILTFNRNEMYIKRSISVIGGLPADRQRGQSHNTKIPSGQLSLGNAQKL